MSRRERGDHFFNQPASDIKWWLFSNEASDRKKRQRINVLHCRHGRRTLVNNSITPRPFNLSLVWSLRVFPSIWVLVTIGKHKCPTSPPWTNASFLSILIHPLPCSHLSQPLSLSLRTIHSPIFVYCGSLPLRKAAQLDLASWLPLPIPILHNKSPSSRSVLYYRSIFPTHSTRPWP